MRSRRQGLSDAVSVLGMDPWKDDRVRDFVAINTIQRLRAYHLPPGAPMPPIEDINADRALNLLLLPRAGPDYRPCAGERPPTRSELRMRHRENTRAQGQQQRQQRDREDEEGEGMTGSTQPGQNNSSASTASTTTSSSDSDDENTGKSSVQQRGSEDAPLNQTPARQPPLSRLPYSPEVPEEAISSRQCAVDRARALFFGATSFHASTSPRRLLNSPHVPLTPSVTSISPIAERQTPHRETLQLPESASAVASTPSSAAHSSNSNAAGRREVHGLRANLPLASRSLNMDLDADIESSSTPLRLAPPPPLLSVGATTALEPTAECEARQGEGEANEDNEDSGTRASSTHRPNSDARAMRLPRLPGEVKGEAEDNEGSPAPSLDTTPAAIRPTAEGTNLTERDTRAYIDDDDDGSGCHGSCDVCDAIIQYFQSMLTRGVVLDRYNHKDLAFAWWVLGRNMDTAALENRGPMRREALLITIRNLYYGLLSTEEAKKTKASTAEAETLVNAVDRAAAAVVAHGEAEDSVPARDSKADEEGTAVVGSQRRSKGAAADTDVPAPTPRLRGRGRHPGATSATLQEAPASTTAAATRKRPRSGQEGRNPEGDAEADHRTESAHATSDKAPLQLQRLDKLVDGARTPAVSIGAPLKASVMHSSRVSVAAEASSETTGGKFLQQQSTTDCTATADPLAVALRGDDVSQNQLTNEDNVDNTASGPASLMSSATTSRAGSVAPTGTSGSGGGGKRRRRAEDRRRAVEETWASTRTNRRTASAKSATGAEVNDDGVLAAGPTVMAREGDAEREPTGAEARTAAPVSTVRQGTSLKTKVTNAAASVASKLSPKTKAALKVARSPDNDKDDNSGSDGEGEEDDAIPDGTRAGSAEDVEGGTAPKRLHAKADQRATSKKAMINTAKAPHGRMTDSTADSSSDRKGAAVDTATTAKTAASVSVPKKGKSQSQQRPEPPEKKEEHRGRPRGSFKVPRPAVSGTPAATAGGGSHKAGAFAAAGATRSVEKRREDESSTPVSSPSTPAVPIGGSVGASPSAAATDHSSKTLPVPREMPLGLTAHERVVRARIQHRMGVPLPPPSATTAPLSPSSESSSLTPAEVAAADTPMTVYSSYTFLLSSFASHGQLVAGRDSAATTAPVLWYGPVAPSGSRTMATEKRNAAAAPIVRLRGRRKKAEGGVDRAALGFASRYDQAALERQVQARLAREAADAARHFIKSSRVSQDEHPPTESAVKTENVGECSTVNVKQEYDDDRDDVSTPKEEMVDDDEAERPPTLNAPLSHPLSAPLLQNVLPALQPSALGSPSAPSEVALRAENGGRAASTQEAHASPPPQPPVSFAELTYAQQCLLVWTAGGLLERHERLRQAVEARRARLLAHCGRMATRRMAARVAAAAEGSGMCEEVETSAKQLVKLLAQEENVDEALDSGSGTGSESCDDESREEESERAQQKQGRPRPGASATARKDNEENEEGDDDESSASSMEAHCKALRPLPRRLYDYWAAYRTSGNAAASAGTSTT
ncbi:hypothetical protein ABL78_6725 [Leptomonas seymouri]|uniref:Uncharacterized protein n=1 Tax=Leptomonas seymouri TaxID=5684 RepID=A0A0N0P3J8_LEPSE|nr:hypothetical protein ABL78_6725 [Leptomonas seymouri]|eukprot:KPI84209.1 hypothetical protein ABL78_6725 [Leptomonas seymouri]